MGKESWRFRDIEIENNKFYCHKSPISLKDVDSQKVFVSKKIYSGRKNYKYFIGYLHDDYKVEPLHIMLPKASAYVKCHDGQAKWMYFFYWKW